MNPITFSTMNQITFSNTGFVSQSKIWIELRHKELYVESSWPNPPPHKEKELYVESSWRNRPPCPGLFVQLNARLFEEEDKWQEKSRWPESLDPFCCCCFWRLIPSVSMTWWYSFFQFPIDRNIRLMVMFFLKDGWSSKKTWTPLEDGASPTSLPTHCLTSRFCRFTNEKGNSCKKKRKNYHL